MHCYKIYKPHAYTQTFCRANFSTIRTINDWNNLPVNAVDCRGVGTGPADPATAGPKFPQCTSREPTINIIH